MLWLRVQRNWLLSMLSWARILSASGDAQRRIRPFGAEGFAGRNHMQMVTVEGVSVGVMGREVGSIVAGLNG